MLNTNRIAWFLKLQQIVRFPRAFLAPSVLPPRGRRRYSSPSDPTTTVLPVQPEARNSWRLQVLRRPPLPLEKYVGVSAITPAGRFGVEGHPILVDRLANAPGARITPTSSSKRSSLQTSQAPSSASMRTAIATLKGQGSRQRSENDRIKATRAHASVASSIVLASSHSQPVQPSVAPRSKISEHTTEGFDSFPNSTNFRDQVMREAISRDQPELTDQAQARAGKMPQIKANSVSTLHIDGAALGQWAIQHLERALGRPTTGMTGVDPRNTLPRTRVAPF